MKTSEVKIKHLLKEKEILLSEVHHRVNNNLQVITCLLNLQMDFIDDEIVIGYFREYQHRIKSIALIQKTLYQTNNYISADFGHYVRQLVQSLIRSIKGLDSNIELKINSKDLFLNVDTSILLDLVISEIVTNALKRSFKNMKKGILSIEIEKLDYPNFIIRIGDNAQGVSEDVFYKNPKPFGLKLIHKLVRQLRGNIEKGNFKEETNNYIITFQEINNKRKRNGTEYPNC